MLVDLSHLIGSLSCDGRCGNLGCHNALIREFERIFAQCLVVYDKFVLSAMVVGRECIASRYTFVEIWSMIR